MLQVWEITDSEHLLCEAATLDAVLERLDGECRRRFHRPGSRGGPYRFEVRTDQGTVLGTLTTSPSRDRPYRSVIVEELRAAGV